MGVGVNSKKAWQRSLLEYLFVLSGFIIFSYIFVKNKALL